MDWNLGLYRFVRAALATLCRLAFRVRISGADRLPATGPYVLAPSHRSIIDIFVCSTLTRRRLRFMAKVELFRVPVLGPFLGLMGSFPVERGATDRSAIEAGAQVLAEGEVLVIYPEGTRSNGAHITDLHRGAAYLAIKAGAPVVPVGIGGTESILPSGSRIPKLHEVAIVVGDPIPSPTDDGTARRTDVRAVTDAIRSELQAAFDIANTLAHVDRDA
ncbi:MAG: 1-acyl-sn-glycerol-3-phosphate acyltransferase [Acidimicrobiia bacterium]|nr:1-acyl-sn-glycerol-3-phosphate acyltransferase [Acidimicrobiia bacterium]